MPYTDWNYSTPNWTNNTSPPINQQNLIDIGNAIQHMNITPAQLTQLNANPTDTLGMILTKINEGGGGESGSNKIPTTDQSYFIFFAPSNTVTGFDFSNFAGYLHPITAVYDVQKNKYSASLTYITDVIIQDKSTLVFCLLAPNNSLNVINTNATVNIHGKFGGSAGNIITYTYQKSSEWNPGAFTAQDIGLPSSYYIKFFQYGKFISNNPEIGSAYSIEIPLTLEYDPPN